MECLLTDLAPPPYEKASLGLGHQSASFDFLDGDTLPYLEDSRELHYCKFLNHRKYTRTKAPARMKNTEAVSKTT